MKKVFLLVLMLTMASSLAYAQAQQDTLTITTYYPAPYGEYKQIKLTPTEDIDVTNSCSDEGAVFYNGKDRKIYYCDGHDWQTFGGELETKVVSSKEAHTPEVYCKSGWVRTGCGASGDSENWARAISGEGCGCWFDGDGVCQAICTRTR